MAEMTPSKIHELVHLFESGSGKWVCIQYTAEGRTLTYTSNRSDALPIISTCLQFEKTQFRDLELFHKTIYVVDAKSERWSVNDPLLNDYINAVEAEIATMSTYYQQFLGRVIRKPTTSE